MIQRKFVAWAFVVLGLGLPFNEIRTAFPLMASEQQLGTIEG